MTLLVIKLNLYTTELEIRHVFNLLLLEIRLDLGRCRSG